MRILIIKESRSESGMEGVGRYVLDLCQQLRQHDISHTVVYNAYDRLYDRLSADGTTVIVTDLPPNSWHNYLHPFRLLKIRRTIARIIDQGQFTQVWALFPGLLSALRGNLRKNRVKVIARWPGAFEANFRLPILGPKGLMDLTTVLRNIYRKYILFNFSKADTVLCPSETAAHTATYTFGVPTEKIRIVPNGTNMRIANFDLERKLNEFRNSNSSAKRKIISVGRETTAKGVIDFCLLAERMVQRGDVEFVFLGGARNEEFHNTLVEKYGNSVTFAGMQLDIAPFYSNAYLHVFLSHRESFGRVLIESMQFGLPSVCWNVLGVSELIEDHQNGFLINFANFDALEERVTRLLDDQSYYEKHSRGIMSQSTQHSLDKHYIKLRNIIIDT